MPLHVNNRPVLWPKFEPIDTATYARLIMPAPSDHPKLVRSDASILSKPSNNLSLDVPAPPELERQVARTIYANNSQVEFLRPIPPRPEGAFDLLADDLPCVLDSEAWDNFL